MSSRRQSSSSFAGLSAGLCTLSNPFTASSALGGWPTQICRTPLRRQAQPQAVGCQQSRGGIFWLEGKFPLIPKSPAGSYIEINCVARLGGMCGAIVTSPFDVVKTRLQSSLFREKHATQVGVLGTEGLSGGATLIAKRPVGLLYNFVETGYILRYVCTNHAIGSSN